MSDGTSEMLEAWTQFGLASALMLVAALLFLAASCLSALHGHFSARRTATVLAQSRAEWDRLWAEVESHSRDKPHTAVNAAHELICELLRARGLHFEPSTASTDERAIEDNRAAIEMYEHYRSAVAHHRKSAPGRVNTSALKEALGHYRWLFQALWDPNMVQAAHHLRQHARVPRTSSNVVRPMRTLNAVKRRSGVCQVLRDMDVPPPSSTQLA